VKSQETGTQEMMQTQEHNRYQDVQDGLFPLVDNYRIQDFNVELIGIRSLPHPVSSTGVVQSVMAAALGMCGSILYLVLRTPAVRGALTVSVPSGA